MPPTLRALELDLIVEQGGHRAAVTGQDGRFFVDFPGLAALVYFLRWGWRWRKFAPAGVTVIFRWRGYRIKVLSDSRA